MEIREANRITPDRTSCFAASHLGLFYFPKLHFNFLSRAMNPSFSILTDTVLNIDIPRTKITKSDYNA